MSSKKSRDSSKSKSSSKDETREERQRRSSKDYRSTADDQEGSSRHREKSKSKHSSKSANVDDEAMAQAEEEERRRQKKERKRLEEEERLRREKEEQEEEERRRLKKERKRLEEEERLRREQEEQEEEERRRRKEKKNRDMENGDSRKHKSSRAATSPRDPSPPPAPSKHKSQMDRDDNYSDDFVQNYDDDFDDEPAPPPPPTKKSSSSRYDDRYRSMDDEPAPSRKSYPPSDTREDVQVYSTSGRFQYRDLSDRIRRRYKDLSRLIVLDRQSFNILEMSPMPLHALYMRDLRLTNANPSSQSGQSTNADQGTGWTTNVKTQTNDDAENVPSQTDEIDVRSMWTQHPSDSERTACGSGNLADEKEFSDEKRKRENEELLRMLRLETDLARYQTFVINAGKLMFALLDEQQNNSIKSKSKRSKDEDGQEGMQKESDLNFSSGMTILPGLQSTSEISIAATCFCQDKPEQVAVFYEPNYTTSYGAIYSVRNPEKPLRLLSCEAAIGCCSSVTNYVFAGCHDGSVVVFDTSEPNRYKPNSSDPLPSGPTFSTANIQFNDRHLNQVICVLPLRGTGANSKADRSSGSFPLASLDRDGLIIVWSVVELLQSDEAGSIADLGLKPGGKVRMTQTSSLQIKQSIHMARGSIQAYDMSCPYNDMDHLYVASNASAVYHMTRYGEMGSPAKLRLPSASESPIEVTCLSFNPVVSKLLLVGTGHGQLNLYTTGRDEPILLLPNAFRSTSSVLSCGWSAGRASVFFAHDSQGYIKYWDLTKDLYQPAGQVKIDNLQHFILSSSNQYETAFALVVRQQSSQLEIHQLKRSFAAHSDSFMDNFKSILKELMSSG